MSLSHMTQEQIMDAARKTAETILTKWAVQPSTDPTRVARSTTR